MEAGAKGVKHPAVRPAGRVGNGPHRERQCRAASRCRRCGRRSSTGSPRPRPPRGTSASRSGSINGDYLTRGVRPMPLMPKRVKYRKSQRGKVRGKATRGNTVAFGDFGLQSLEGGWLSAETHRGRPHHGDALRPRRGPALHPRLPAQVGHVDPRRDAHGQGQGRAGVLGRRRQAGHDPVRDRRAARGRRPRLPGPRGLQDAVPLPVRARRPTAIGG